MSDGIIMAENANSNCHDEQQQLLDFLLTPVTRKDENSVKERITPPTTTNSSMPQMSGIIKKTCEMCVRSKVKCDGNDPCDRCLKKGDECVYVMEQKRGRRPASTTTTSVRTPKRATRTSPSSPKRHQPIPPPPTPPPPSPPQLPLQTIFPVHAFQRRMFRIVFSLFKFHRDVSDAWFSLKFTQLGLVLRRDKDIAACTSLVRWLEHHKVPIVVAGDGSAAGASAAALPKLVNLPCSMVVPLEGSEAMSKMYLGSIHVENDKVWCSPDITKWFGYNSTGTNFPYPSALVGKYFLPWGADVFSQIGDDDSQVLAYVRDVAYVLKQDELIHPVAMRRTVSLLDRPFSLRTAATTGLGDGPVTTAPIKCLVSCQITQTHGMNFSCAFDFYLFPMVGVGEDSTLNKHGSPSTNSARANVLVSLPDLELGPWTESSTWFNDLLRWAKRPSL